MKHHSEACSSIFDMHWVMYRELMPKGFTVLLWDIWRSIFNSKSGHYMLPLAAPIESSLTNWPSCQIWLHSTFYFSPKWSRLVAVSTHWRRSSAHYKCTSASCKKRFSEHVYKIAVGRKLTWRGYWPSLNEMSFYFFKGRQRTSQSIDSPQSAGFYSN